MNSNETRLQELRIQSEMIKAKCKSQINLLTILIEDATAIRQNSQRVINLSNSIIKDQGRLALSLGPLRK